MANRFLEILKDKILGSVVKILILILLIAGGIWLALWLMRGTHMEVGTNKRIDLTPTQIESIRNIGQWEFLSVKDEELVDTMVRGFISDKELVRIYYGTLRLGIDLQRAEGDWIHVDDSVIIAKLPPIQLLDRNFIDEAQTRSFFESGSWTAADREDLYKRAYQKMLDRCLTKENITAAEEHAREQFTMLLRSLGFEHVSVEVEKSHRK